MTIANTILQQLGGHKFTVMTGAKNLIGLSDGLSLRLPSNFATDGINYIRITLSPADTYDIEFARIRGLKITPLGSIDGVYCDDLRRIISDKTGLALSL